MEENDLEYHVDLDHLLRLILTEMTHWNQRDQVIGYACFLQQKTILEVATMIHEPYFKVRTKVHRLLMRLYRLLKREGWEDFCFN